MIVEAGGGKGGFKEYLENGIKAGRDFHRNELDQRVPLFGDLDVFELATSLDEGEGRKYDHITLSFSERHVTNEMLQIAVNEFRNHALSAWPEEERHRVPYYAEAHRPKLQSYINSETGKDMERFIHIHIGMGRHDLFTRKAIEPLGYLGPGTDNIKFIDAWQESFNSKHGFSSPKDNPRITPENALDVIARYTGHVPDAFGTQNEKKTALEITLQKDVISKNVTTWEALRKLLSSYGEVSKINEGKFNESYRIKLPDAEKAMRLQSVFFQRQFIERSTTEKIEIISAKARVAYLEQMLPRKEPQYVAEVLAEWHTTKAKEFRYLNTGGRYYKNVYLPADAQTRLQILNELERKHHGITSSSTAQNRKIATSRNRVPDMPIRDLDGIQNRTEMLLRDHTSVDVRADSAGEQMGSGVRQADGRDRRDAAEVNTKNGSAFRPGESIVWFADRESAEEESHRIRVSGDRLIQPSSVLARVQADMRERYEQAADKERYAEMRQHLDCVQLLASLSHSHRLNPALYRVMAAKDGTPRIKCGSRALTPSDFLTKELGLPWKDAAPILRQTYENQIGKKATKVRGHAEKSQIWDDFRAARLADLPAVEQRQKAFDVETKTNRRALFATLAIQKKKALFGLVGESKKAAESLADGHAATAKAEFKEERQALRKSIRPRQVDAWPMFLQARAQAGSEEALATLRKLDATARVVPAKAITGTIYLVDDEDEKKRRRRARESAATILKALVHQVEANGDITYSKNGHAVLRDEGQHIAVLDQNSDEAIAAALLLGHEKFGPNLTLTGSPEFQRHVVAVAVAQGIPIKFVDPQLEAIRLQLTDEKRQAARSPTREKVTHAPVHAEAKPSHPVEAVAPTPSNRPAKRGTKAPAPEILAPSELHQVVPEAVQTAAQWSAGQSRPVVPPHVDGDASVAYVVLHVAPDGIVVDHGRALATYPVPPTGLVLQAGDRVVIGRNGELCLPHEPEPGKEKEGGIG